MTGLHKRALTKGNLFLFFPVSVYLTTIVKIFPQALGLSLSMALVVCKDG